MPVNLEDQYDKIYQYCYFKVKNKETAEDLTQETFLRYFAQNTNLNHGKPLAYLYTIAKNKCTDYFRKKQTEPLDETFALEDETPAVLTHLVVRQAVKALPAELAEIVLLRFGSELLIHEIAAVLHLSRFAVHRKLNAALKELNKLLRKEDFYE